MIQFSKDFLEFSNLQEKLIFTGNKCIQYLGIHITNYGQDIYKYYKTQWNKRRTKYM